MDLSTTYMGLPLAHPIVPSAGPLTNSVDRIKRLEDAGASAVVLPSLFEESIEHDSHVLDHYLNYGTESFAEATTYFPNLSTLSVGPDEYLDLVRRAKAATNIPIIASLNGRSSGGWTRYASLIEEAGADAIELNIYMLATDLHTTSAHVEQVYLDVLREVKQRVHIPVAMKLSPFFTATADMCRRLSEKGANALVLFNRFYQPDFDLDNLEVTPHLVLSDSDELRLPLRWVAILYGRIKANLAVTTGVHTHLDVLKSVMAGAHVTMMASELLHNGLGRIQEVLKDTQDWMEAREYVSIGQMRGSMSQQSVANPNVFERANYMKVLQSWRPEPGSVAVAKK